MAKLVIEISGQLEENDILIYKNGKFCPVRIKTLLPELKEMERIDALEERVKELEEKVRELRGEDE